MLTPPQWPKDSPVTLQVGHNSRAGLASIKETPLRLLVNALTRTLEAAKTLSDYPTNWNFTKTTIKKL